MGKTIKEQFFEALENGITHKAMYLLQFMKDEINEPYDYCSPLIWAKKYGNEKVIKALRDMGAVEVVDKEGMGKELIKILDADKIDEKRAIELIKDGANLEVKNEFGNTALIWASIYGHVEIVKALLSRGAKVDEKNNYSETALMRASANGNVEVVKALLDAGAKVDEKNNNSRTALMYASGHNRLDVVKTLIDAGAKVDEKDIYGDTALIKASRSHLVKITKALLDAGADVTITNNKGNTAIDCAINDEIEKMLNDAFIKQKMQKFKNKISVFFGR